MLSQDTGPPAPTGLEVRPFRALTYRRRDPAYLARVSSPAYDLVTPESRDRLAAAHQHNIVRLILPGGPAADGSAHEAAELLERWCDEGVLQEDAEPALWLYELAPPDGVPPTLGWLGAVALPAASSDAVLPHEDTYAPAVEGRRALLAATRTDLEPIVLAHDPVPELEGLVGRVRSAAVPDLRLVDDDGVGHSLWRVGDPGLVADVRRALAGSRAVIADGHHRFAAARAHAASSPEVAGADAVLALVTSSGAGGLRVEAIHRVLPGLGLDDAVGLAAAGFDTEELPGGEPEDTAPRARGWLASAPPGSFLLSDGRRLVALTHPRPELAAGIPAGAPAAWRDLDVVLAHHGLVERLWELRDEPGSLQIAHDVPSALAAAAGTGGTALLLRPPFPGDVAAVARAGARMPRKSTLFVPKPRTGMVLRPLGR